MDFIKITSSETKGVLNIKRGIHLSELDWGGDMECGIDLHDRQFATHIEPDTPFRNFEKGPVLRWS